MPKKLPHTPTSRIKNDLRRLWLRSRERAAAVKREHNTCQRCGAKGSVAKGREVAIEVHHLDGINWDGLIREIRLRLLVNPDNLEVLCKECHGKNQIN
jgi:5-methylcytosine-specific restriction endonuclease McrA